MEIEQLLERLKGVRPNGSGFMSLCPAHHDRKQSLSVSNGDGVILIKCHAGCETEDVVCRMGLTMADLFHDGKPRSNGKRVLPPVPEPAPINPTEVNRMHQALTATQRDLLIEQRCLSGEMIDRYQLGFTEKFGDRRVAIPIYDGEGACRDVRCWLPEVYRNLTEAPKIFHWEKGRGGARLFPIDQLTHDSLLLVGGELDALAAISNGYQAITATCGEAMWKEELSMPFAGKQVRILLDNDDAGRDGTEKRARSLSQHGARVEIVTW